MMNRALPIFLLAVIASTSVSFAADFREPIGPPVRNFEKPELVPLKPLTIPALSVEKPGLLPIEQGILGEPEPTNVSRVPAAPKWARVKTDPTIRLFPVMSDGKLIYISLIGEGFSISASLEGKLQELSTAYPSGNDFYLDPALTKRVFDELKISGKETLFWFLFDQPVPRSLQIGKINRLVVKPNNAAGLLGTIAIEVEITEKM